MGSCFAKAPRFAESKECGDGLEFKQHEPSLSQSSDGMAWTSPSASQRQESVRLTVVAAKNYKRRESEIIKTAKENLKKVPARSSLKLSSARTNSTVMSNSKRDGTGDQSEDAYPSNTSSTRDLLESGSAMSQNGSVAEGACPKGGAVTDPGRGKDLSCQSHPLRRSVSFCQEVIMIQYSKRGFS
mmetsp:Transcript_28940/g.61034  ORF Transcript_28940/g.61034 Transcript_28940/m.61034 type:complete len:185 (-) Transcript_28940:425-979(-)